MIERNNMAKKIIKKQNKNRLIWENTRLEGKIFTREKLLNIPNLSILYCIKK